MRTFLACAITLSATIAPSSEAFAVGDPPPVQGETTVTSNTFSTRRADGLKVFNYSIGNGTTLVFKTAGCDTPSDNGNLPDTVLYLLEATSSPSEFITQAFNDDFAGRGLCSQVSITNNTGSTKSYVVIAAAKNDVRVGEISMTAQIGQGQSFVSTIYAPTFVGGGRWARGWNATPRCGGGLAARNPDLFSTIPISSSVAGGGNRGLSDPQLWAINRTPGQLSYRDLDSGIERHARLDMTNKAACTGACDIVVGATNTSPALVCPNADTSCDTGVAKVWTQERLGCDTDLDGVVDAVEAAEGTAPTKVDTDDDGIPDLAELYGLQEGVSLAGFETGTDNLPYKGASPKTQDLFILMDWWQSAQQSFKPYPTIGRDLNDIFSNDESFTGRKINVHAFHGINVESNGGHRIATLQCPEGTPVLSEEAGATLASLYTYKGPRLTALQVPVYHYALFVQRIFKQNPDCNAGIVQGVAGLGEVLGNDVLIKAGDPAVNSNFPPSGASNKQLSVLIHELGHNFLDNSDDHAGNGDNLHASCIHSSVMNGRYQTGWGETGGVTLVPSGPMPTGLGPAVMRRFGYSNGTCAAVDVLSELHEAKCGESFCDPVTHCEASGTSLKTGCPLGGSCDCDNLINDKSEWTRLDLDFSCVGGGNCDEEDFGD